MIDMLSRGEWPLITTFQAGARELDVSQSTAALQHNDLVT